MTEKPTPRYQISFGQTGPPITHPPILLFEKKLLTEAFSLSESHLSGNPAWETSSRLTPYYSRTLRGKGSVSHWPNEIARQRSKIMKSHEKD